MKDKVELLLNKPVSRKEFLQHVGFALLGLIGVSGMIKALSKSVSGTTQSSSADFGYGSNPYGGHKK